MSDSQREAEVRALNQRARQALLLAGCAGALAVYQPLGAGLDRYAVWAALAGAGVHGLGFGLGLRRAWRRIRLPRAFKAAGAGVHTARWASEDEIRAAGMRKPGGPFYGIDDNGPLYEPKRPKVVHTKIIATAGAGKSTAEIKPRIMWLALQDEPVSLVIPDVKDGELTAECAGPLQREGCEVVVVDDAGVSHAAHTPVNPFAPVIEAEENKPRLVGPAARELALVLEPEPASDAKNKFFRENPRDIMQFGMRYLARHHADDCTPNGLSVLLSSQTALDRTLELAGLDGGGLGALAERLVQRRDHGAPEHWADFLSTAQKRLEIYEEGGLLEHAGRGAQIEHGAIRERPMVVFLPAPFGLINDYSPYIIKQIHGFMQACKRPGRVPVHFMLDEMTNTPLPRLPADLTIIRGYGGRATLAVQAESEIEAKYDKQARTIEGLCKAVHILGVDDMAEAKRISEGLGRASAPAASVNTDPAERAQGGGLSDPGRPLIEPHELMALGPDEKIVLVSGMRPIKCQKLYQNQIMPWAEMFDINPVEGGRMKPDPKVRVKWKRKKKRRAA